MAGTLHRAHLNKFALGTAFALVTTPLVGVGQAQAGPNGCTPTTPIDNQTITCTGTTTNTNGNVGFGTAADTGNTYHVTSGAAVNGDAIGLLFGVGTVNVDAQGSIQGLNAGSSGISANTATVTNSGFIAGSSNGIATLSLTLTNNLGGTITSALGGVGVLGISSVTIKGNNGTISGDTAAIQAGDPTVIQSNAKADIANGSGGGIAGNAFGIRATGDVTLTNAGIVQGDTAIAGRNVTVTNDDSAGTRAAQITGVSFGINATGDVVVSNSHTAEITAASGGTAIHGNTVTISTNDRDIDASGTGSFGVKADTAVTVTSNTGKIFADTAISSGGSANITNLAGGQINGVTSGVHALGDVRIANAGTISASDPNGGLAISGRTVTLSNASTGTISGFRAIAARDSVSVDNSGQINGLFFAVAAVGVSVSNSGTISATNPTSVAITGTTGGTVVRNVGTISGKVAISSDGAANITNSGTIKSTAGATGTAIKLSSAADTLNIKKGSQIIGMIDMGGGADVINVDGSGSSAPKGVSMLSRATSAVVDALNRQLENFTGMINIIGGNSASVQPSVTVNGVTASLDPTALAQQDRTLMDFTGGMSSMVQDRLRGSATGGASGPMAMSYAMDSGAQMFSKAPAASWNTPVTVWSSMFGASRSQNGTDTTLDSTSSVFGGVIGVDRRITPDWLVGAFVGGGSGSLNVSLASQKLNTDYVSGGVYSRFEWGSQFFDATLQGGGINNRSDRLVQNTINGGVEHATASYNGWFISPEVAYGYRIKFGDTLITPMLRARYVAGVLDGYNEAGSAQTLSIGSRTLQDFEERAEVEISKNGFFGDPSLKGWFRGGAIALQRVGDANINAVLIGQSLSFVTPGKSSATGGVVSVGFDYRLTPNVSLYGALEGMMMSDESKVGSARGGVKVAF